MTRTRFHQNQFIRIHQTNVTRAGSTPSSKSHHSSGSSSSSSSSHKRKAPPSTTRLDGPAAKMARAIGTDPGKEAKFLETTDLMRKSSSTSSHESKKVKVSSNKGSHDWTVIIGPNLWCQRVGDPVLLGSLIIFLAQLVRGCCYCCYVGAFFSRYFECAWSSQVSLPELVTILHSALNLLHLCTITGVMLECAFKYIWHLGRKLVDEQKRAPIYLIIQ